MVSRYPSSNVQETSVNSYSSSANYLVLTVDPSLLSLHSLASLTKFLTDGVGIYEIGERYTGSLREREMLENLILSKGAGGTCYLCSETTAFIESGKEIGGDDMEDKRKQIRTGVHI